MLQVFIRGLSHWHIAALKDECRRLNIDSRGERSILLFRLQQFYERKQHAQQSAQSQQLHTPAASDHRYRSTAAEYSYGNADLMQHQSIGGNTADYHQPTDDRTRQQPHQMYSLDSSLPSGIQVCQVESGTSSTPSSLPRIGADRQFFVSINKPAESFLQSQHSPVYDQTKPRTAPGLSTYPVAPGRNSSSLPTTVQQAPSWSARPGSLDQQTQIRRLPGLPTETYAAPGISALTHVESGLQVPNPYKPGLPASACSSPGRSAISLTSYESLPGTPDDPPAPADTPNRTSAGNQPASSYANSATTQGNRGSSPALIQLSDNIIPGDPGHPPAPVRSEYNAPAGHQLAPGYAYNHVASESAEISNTMPGLPGDPSGKTHVPVPGIPGYPASLSHLVPGLPGYLTTPDHQAPGHPGYPVAPTSSQLYPVVHAKPSTYTGLPGSPGFIQSPEIQIHPNITVRRTNVRNSDAYVPNVHFSDPHVTGTRSASPSSVTGGDNLSSTGITGESYSNPASTTMYTNLQPHIHNSMHSQPDNFGARSKVSSLPKPLSSAYNPHHAPDSRSDAIGSSQANQYINEHSPGLYPSLMTNAHHSVPNHKPLVTAAPIQGSGISNSTGLESSSPNNVVTTPQFTHLPDAHSTQRQVHSSPTPSDELSVFEHQLKILRMKEDIRNTQHCLNLPPDSRNSTTAHNDQTNVDMQTMISYVKKSIDVNSTPTGKPFVFSGNPLQYPTWKASFDLLVSEKDISQAQKLTILLSHVSGDAKEWIEYYIMSDSEYVFDEAMQALEENFGDPFEVADAFREKLESWQKIGGSDCKALKKYAQFLKQCKIAMTTNEHLEDLDNPRQFRNLVKTLPVHLMQRWSREAGKNKRRTQRNPTFAEYADFVMEEALLACDKTTSYQAMISDQKERRPAKKETTNKRKENSSFTHSTQTSDNSKPDNKKRLDNPKSTQSSQPTQATGGSKPTLHCNHCKTTKSHITAECRKFSRMTFIDQQSFIKKEGLCFHCLEKGHSKQECTSSVTCSKCSGKHATCLHRKPSDGSSTQSNSSGSQAATETTVHRIQGQSGSKQTVTTMTMPVYISSAEDPTNEILIYALIDGQSDKTYILQEVSDLLHTARIQRKLKVSTITSIDEIQWCDRLTNLRVRGFNTSEIITVDELFSLQSIPANRNHIPTPDTAEAWPHLAHISDRLVPLQECAVGMIIGFPCSVASLPLETVDCESDRTLPYAVRTVLGWSVIGGRDSTSHGPISHRICSQDITTDQVLKRLEEDLTAPHNKPPMSQNDLKFLDIMDSNITKDSKGFYTMPLPFKQKPNMPDNRAYAMNRFKGLERKLKANPELNTKYREFMDDILSKGEAEEIKEPGTNGWYIPHHGVFHPHKPGKLRVVYDCSSAFRGHSLNKNLLQGPDLNNSLAGLLCRFRKERIAVTCDVRKMFHQFRVQEADREYLRFLWYRGGSSDIIDYHMNVHLFGATSSPSCAIYGMQKIASDYSSQYPAAAQFVQENFYVDDGLASVASPTEAIQLMTDARDMLSKGNLLLHKFLSNSDQVAKELGCDGPATKVIADDQDLDRTLGLCWNVQDDIFTFSEIPIKPSTRRGVLSTVASLFDPLGLLAPFSLKGKQLLQQLCHEKVDWDEPLDENQMKTWTNWTTDLKNLSEVKIDRCFLGKDMCFRNEAELHTFSDASEMGYGSCSYLRLLNRQTNKVSVSLVLGKSRVTPRKYVSMPRLELQAATLAVKCQDFLINELKYDDMKSFLWTDSTAVLGYITNEARKFHIFVYNRVQRIKDTTKAEQWNYVSTNSNPADIASRGCGLADLSSTWLHGPDFLKDIHFVPETSSKEYALNPEDPEIRKVFAHTASAKLDENRILITLRKHSNWEKVTKVMTHIIRFTSGVRKHQVNSDVVFNSLVKAIQSEYFYKEIHQLSKDEKICKSSPLYCLDPFLDKNGILRVGGRLRNSLATYETRHPAALPGQEILTRVFIRYKHAQAAHQGRNTTINAIRSSGIHIIGGIKTVSSVIYNCIKCKKLRGAAVGQKMADLPHARAEPSPPFTYTGMDVFGPFVVKDYRKEVKRYGLLFTCMASRAIHLELLDDLSTDCFINSMRCFLAIRGPVKTFYSDRGTNFIGAANEYQQGINILSSEEVKKYLETQQSSFSFNVPHASHMGGTWERMIRTVRNVLQGILSERTSTRMDTSSLRTLLYECMYMVNSRPLTTQQLTTDSVIQPQPLTPNNLLTMKNQPLQAPPGNFDEADMYSRKRWRRVQYLCEQFWSRWKPEYLQSLQKRSKWRDIKQNLEPGDVVLLKDKDLPRCQWKLGRIVKVLPSHDELVRKVELRTGGGQIYQRPIHNLILLVANSS